MRVEGHSEVVEGTCCRDQHGLVLLLKFEVEDNLEHDLDDIDVQFDVVLLQLFKELQEAPKYPEASMFLLVLKNRAYELLEFLFSNILKTVAILEEFVGPLNQVSVRCQSLAFICFQQLRFVLREKFSASSGSLGSSTSWTQRCCLLGVLCEYLGISFILAFLSYGLG